MSTYLQNTLVANFDVVEIDDITNIYTGNEKTGSLNIYNYDFVRLKEIRDFFTLIPDAWIGYTTITNNTNFEKLAYDIYGNMHYWDIILMLNNRLPLFDNSYDYDILISMTDSALDDYEQNVIKRVMSDAERQEFNTMYLDKLSEQNENNRVVKYIYPEKMSEVIIKMRELDLLSST